MISLGSVAALALLASRVVVAQTSTSCNPLNSTCPQDTALGTTYNQMFNGTESEMNSHYWNMTAGEDLLKFANEGLQMPLNQKGQSITAQTNFYIFFGTVEIEFQAAAGAGIISTLNFLSDDLDEIDIEVKGDNTTHVSTNWYGQGNQTQNNAIWYPVDQPAAKSHIYKVVWEANATEWYFDNQLVRTVPAAAPKMYPQTPSYIKMGVWPAGDSPSQGTSQWAGGAVDWSKAPYTMTVKSFNVTDSHTNTTTYSYPDPSDGSWQSIKVVQGQSPAAQQIQKPDKNVAQKFEGLSTTAKIAIIASVFGVIALVLVVFLICCCRSRSQGKKMRAAEDARWEQEQTELQNYKTEYSSTSAFSSQQHFEKY